MGQRNTPGNVPCYKDPVPLLKKHCLDTEKDDHIDGPTPREWLYGNAPSFVCEAQLAEGESTARSSG